MTLRALAAKVRELPGLEPGYHPQLRAGFAQGIEVAARLIEQAAAPDGLDERVTELEAALRELIEAAEPFGRIPVALMDNAHVDEKRGKTRYSFAYWAARPAATVIDHKWVTRLRNAYDAARLAATPSHPATSETVE